MPFITSDQIRDISVKAVEGFLNNKISLSEGLAKYASAMELNSDQIQRAVEATNSIAYLKILSLSDDRTVEFPLCKYAEVMAGIAVPDMTKAASVTVYKGQAVGKSDAPVQYVPTELNEQEQRIMFVKMAAANQAELNALKDRAVTIVSELEKAASTIKSDIEGLEKLATVADGQVYAMATALVYGEVKPYNDTGIFKAAELKEAEHLLYLLKEAKEVNSAIIEKQELYDRSEMVKQAFLGTLAKGIGFGVGKVVSAPFKMVGRAAGRGAGNAAWHANEAIQGGLNKVRKGLGMPIRPSGINPPYKKSLLIGAAGTLAMGGLDAAMYEPGREQTGRSKDIWTSLQREV